MHTLSQEQFLCFGHDFLPGGRASGLRPSDFNPAELHRGMLIELEHTPNRLLAREIAMDHLAEDPDYYRKLATIHVDGALGDARTNTIDLLATLLGKDRATAVVSDLETVVTDKAREGVQPLVMGAIALGVLGLAAGTIAIVISVRR